MTAQRNRKPGAKAPVSAHPAFPAIVALWFAALLGLGSLVLPIALFERASESSGIASLLTVAEPPLGVTARIVIAIVAGGLGVLAGLAIARKVVAAHAPVLAPQRAPSTYREPARDAAKRPISAHEELGEGGLDADQSEEPRREPMPGRRRALAVTDDSARSEFLERAPLPGGDLPAMDAVAPEPLDLAAFDEDLPEPAADAATGPDPMPQADAVRAGWPQPGKPFGTAALSAPPASLTFGYQAVEPRRVEAIPAAREFTRAVPEPAAASAAATPGIAELVDRFARALESHREQAQARAAEDEIVPVLDVTFALGAKAPAVSAAPVEPPTPVLPAALRPFAFDELANDEDDDEELPALGLSLEAPRFAAPQADAAAGEPDLEADADVDGADDPAEESYSSLLAMKSPFGAPREAVRIDDEPDHEDGGIEPVVVFPGQTGRRASPAADGPARDASGSGLAAAGPRPFDAPLARADAAKSVRFADGLPPRAAGSADTERALREALEKLQKMSGVG